MADEPCAGCGKPMGYGDYMEACGKEYHADCFKCALCKQALEGGAFVVFEDAPCHGACADKAEASGTAQGNVQGASKATAASEVCAGCNKKIVAGVECFRLTGQDGTQQVYHDRCLTCSDCGKPIGGAKFGLCHGKPVHLDTCMHHAQVTKEKAAEFAEELQCSRCKEPIRGQRKVVEGFGIFHLSCFKCHRCGLGIRVEQQFYKDEASGQPICHRCN